MLALISYRAGYSIVLEIPTLNCCAAVFVVRYEFNTSIAPRPASYLFPSLLSISNMERVFHLHMAPCQPINKLKCIRKPITGKWNWIGTLSFVNFACVADYQNEDTFVSEGKNSSAV
jgi:hypothetical protein